MSETVHRHLDIDRDIALGIALVAGIAVLSFAVGSLDVGQATYYLTQDSATAKGVMMGSGAVASGAIGGAALGGASAAAIAGLTATGIGAVLVAGA